MRIVALVALVVIGTALTGPGTSEAVDRFGSDAVWEFLASPESQNTDLHSVLLQCGAPPDGEACVEDVMTDTGASLASIDFFRETGWFLIDFEDFGRVDLGTIVLPWRANANQQYVLLNGDPDIVYVEEGGGELSVKEDPEFDALVEAIGTVTPLNGSPADTLEIFAGENVFEAEHNLPFEGQQFVFQFEVVNGCHACGTGYSERVSFDFGQQGVFVGQFLSGLCRTSGAEVLVPGVLPCPPVQ
jgi:hypothetical protein